jgi:hypothetical protein
MALSGISWARKRTMASIEFGRILLNGTVLSLVLGAIVIVSLIYNARLWLQDYPKPIRDRVPPLSAAEKRGRIVVGVLLLGTLLGGILLETFHLRRESAGSLSFGVAYLDIFLLLLIFNLFDALVIDFFIISLLKPRFVILPGTEDLKDTLIDYRKQVIDFLKGLVFCVVASLPFALIAIL